MTAQSQPNYKISLWLLVCIFLVAAMIALGGATRLTNSGLSITEWRPITGVLPPLSHEQWLQEFEKYKQIPEFMAEHSDMDLKGFEFIYFMEWSHRQLGRLIGMVYAVPFFIFWLRKRFDQGRVWRYFLILVLIGLQGAVGWWMVASGLTHERVDVSQYRLATHLGLAFIILGALYWTWRDHLEYWPESKKPAPLRRGTSITTALIYLQIIAGAFVAGTHSGKAYNTWPLMDGSFVPNGYAVMKPYWRNMFENTAAIQFNHRFLAYIILAMVIWVFVKSRKVSDVRLAATALLILVIWQVGLGIMTLLKIAPLGLSLLHQFTSVLVFLAVLWAARNARSGGLIQSP